MKSVRRLTIAAAVRRAKHQMMLNGTLAVPLNDSYTAVPNTPSDLEAEAHAAYLRTKRLKRWLVVDLVYCTSRRLVGVVVKKDVSGTAEIHVGTSRTSYQWDEVSRVFRWGKHKAIPLRDSGLTSPEDSGDPRGVPDRRGYVAES